MYSHGLPRVGSIVLTQVVHQISDERFELFATQMLRVGICKYCNRYAINTLTICGSLRFQTVMMSSWITSKHSSMDLSSKLVLDTRHFQYSRKVRSFKFQSTMFRNVTRTHSANAKINEREGMGQMNVKQLTKCML